jgi:hypothetical protein
VFEGEAEFSVTDDLRKHYAELGPIVVRAIGLPTDVGPMIEEFRPQSWIAHASSGIVLMAFDNADRIGLVRKRFPAILEKAPLEVRRSTATFGVTGTEKRLIQQMKQTLDPGGRLNPGRHIDGE